MTAEAFLAALYGDVLGREVDATGREAFLGALEAGGPAAEVIERLFASDEYRAALVEGHYQTFLGRQADDAGRAAWAEALRQGASETELLAGFLGSEEFFRALG